MATQKHNNYNYYQENENGKSLAASLTNRLVEVRNKHLQDIGNDMMGNEHKLKLVKSINGIDFINDSRSENTNAVWFALNSINKKITWIMSINDLDTISEALLNVIEEKVNRIVIQGVYDSQIINFFKQLNKEVYFSMNLEETVRIAFYACEPNNEEVILFSPGTPSRGMLRNYKERGDAFIDAIAQL